jgi:hypothetical protein
MNNLWLVYTDEAGVVETAGVYSTAEKANDVAREAERVSRMPWCVRMMAPLDSDWEI